MSFNSFARFVGLGILVLPIGQDCEGIDRGPVVMLEHVLCAKVSVDNGDSGTSRR
jgi:hypothetical protein